MNLRKTKAAVLAAALAVATIASPTAPASAAGGCTISGAAQASWGCGLARWQNNTTVKVWAEDTATDGHCVRIWVKTRNGWVDANRRECSEHAQQFTVTYGEQDILDVRLYRGRNYRTIS